MAFALIPREKAKEGLVAEIEILGEMCKATLVTSPTFEPKGIVFN